MSDEPEFLDRSSDIDRHGKKLPHWQQGSATVFVTFRLADSLPAEKLKELSEFKANWLRMNGGSWNEELETRWSRERAAAMDEKLDEGHGSCCLRQKVARRVVVETLRFGDGSRYRLDAAVVMPNHVHVLFAPTDRFLENEIQAWKSISSRRLKSKLGEGWPGWQRNYHDRLIRSERHFDRVVSYVAANGPKAKLKQDEFWLYLREGLEGG